MSQASQYKTLNLLLKDAKQNLSNNSSPTFVLGNQSADLDSVVCAIVYSLYRILLGHSFYVPVLNVKRSLIYLRKDVCYFLDLFEIDLENLLFADDTLFVDMDVSKASLCLVDHNLVETDFEFLNDIAVLEIIDHHDLHPSHGNTDPKTNTNHTILINSCASCASLVALKIMEFNSQTENRLAVCNLMKMLKLTILLDSNQLSPKKSTDADFKAFDFCNKNSNETELKLKDNEVVSKMKELKASVEGYTLTEMLLKDYKSTTVKKYKLGFSTLINYSLEKIDQNTVEESFFSILKAHTQQNKLDCTVLLLNSQTEKSKEILLFTTNNVLPFDSMIRDLEEDERLDCSKISLDKYKKLSIKSDGISCIGKDAGIHAFKQNNRKLTRKYIMPLITKILSRL